MSVCVSPSLCQIYMRIVRWHKCQARTDGRTASRPSLHARVRASPAKGRQGPRLRCALACSWLTALCANTDNARIALMRRGICVGMCLVVNILEAVVRISRRECVKVFSFAWCRERMERTLRIWQWLRGTEERGFAVTKRNFFFFLFHQIKFT